MRKFLLALVAVAVTACFALASEVTFVSYDKTKHELKVKDGKDEKTYKVGDKTKFKSGDKDVKHDEGVSMLEKLKGDAKIEVTGDKGDVTEVKFSTAKDK